MADTTLNRYWKVRCAMPAQWRHKDMVRTYMANHCLGVTAETIEGAIAVVRQKYPVAVIWAVNHAGAVDHEAKPDAPTVPPDSDSAKKATEECSGFERGGLSPCCDRVGEYNGYNSDGPLLFRCPKSCGCHD